MSLQRLGQELAREQDLLRARRSDRNLVRSRLLALPESTVSSARTRQVLVAALGTALAMAAFALWALPRGAERSLEPRPLLAKIEGGAYTIAAGAFLEAPAGEALGIRFSDRSRLQMAPGARGRLVGLAPTFVHVLLESGQASVEVVPTAKRRFRVSAGPFVVHVTGTRFDMRWEPEQDRFEVDLQRGHVEVSGCAFGQGYRMHAGQRLRASCKRGHFDVAEGPPKGDQTALSEPARAPTAVIEAAASLEQSEQDVARGRAASQPTQPEQAPTPAPSAFQRRCQRASAGQLARLADDARYAGNFEDQDYALRLLRRRFAGTPPGALAAFGLGRLEFDVHSEHRKAAEWFDTYLREQPTGPLAREARGRLMEATFKAGDLRRARALAQSYLSRYPHGPHAAFAHSLQDSEGAR